jgi:hypothetical protein
LVASGADEPTHTRDQTGVLNFPGCVKQLRRDRAHLGIFERLDEIFDPIALAALDVVVEKNEMYASCRDRAEIAFF